jgi:uncharacterized protein
MARGLEVIASCDSCGACCRVVTAPPFHHVFDQEGEDAWERLRWDRPDLRAEILAAERARKAAGEPSSGTPCLWYDAESGRCRHHDYRPRACRAFEIGGQDCRDARRRAGIV